MRTLTVKGVRIDDTFAEAFGMRATAVIVTADSVRWARQAAVTMTGFATSVIGCGAEAGIDRALKPGETPDGRPGVRVLLFVDLDRRIAEAACRRASGSACSPAPARPATPGLRARRRCRLGNALRYFGDGWQISKRFGGKHYWRIPVMDGEFVCEATTGLTKQAVGGGNLHHHGRARPRTRSRPPRPP